MAARRGKSQARRNGSNGLPSWAWLVIGRDGRLAVTATPNQDSPLSAGATPLLGVDVWEHAYYLKYQNKRPDYLDAFWNVVNWDYVAERFAAEVTVKRGDMSVSGRSIMGLMMLAAARGSTLELRARGRDGEAALKALQALIDNHFDEQQAAR